MKKLYQFIFLCVCGITYSQTQNDIETIRSNSNLSELESLSLKYKAEAERNKALALSLAKTNGWSVTFTNKDGTVSELMGVSPDGKSPIYFTPDNVNAAKSTRANFLNSGGGLGLNLNGQSMTAYVWDGGATLPTHNEFGGRVSILDGVTLLTANNNSQHANHVTGTIVAAGAVAAAKGMANQANAKTNEWNNDLAEAGTAATNGMLLSNHSYGWGLRNASGAVIMAPWRFGAYETFARDWDNLMFNAPYYLMIKAAGNDGTDNTANTSPLGGNASYDKLTGYATAKNNLVIANANDAVINATTGALTSVTINTSSSQGPTDDLRIKPDLTGNGTSVYSTATLTATPTPLTNSSYGNATGTSMASPNVTGTLLLLQQHYKNLKGNFMRAATLKGLALHTADDAGATGPDAIFGWGLLNAKFAAETITKNGTFAIIQEHTLPNGSSYSFPVTSDGVNPLIASISWTDPAGTANLGSIVNVSTARLVNDLDIRVTNSSGTALPYRLLSATVNGLGDNTRDPFERIAINGAAGNYTVTISHKGTLVNNLQKYSVIVTGITVPIADLYVKDRPFDTGAEPNPDSGPMWISDDIWVRQNIDAGLTHENPEYKTSSPNAVYIRVYNKGTNPSSSAKVKLYFAKASSGLTWPTNFVNFSIGTVKHGDEIGEVSIPSILPGSSTIVMVPWYPPNPADFATDIHHFCLTARIESPRDPMANEVNNISIAANAKNNNNIAWKNLSVYNLNTTDVVAPTAVFIRGIKSKLINIKFVDKGFNEELKNNFFELGGTIEATLDERLFERAQSNGSLKGVKILDKNKILITSREASIANLPIGIGETFTMTFDFRVAQDFPEDQQITLDLVQEDAQKGELEGGERFALVKADKPKKESNEIVLKEAAESGVITIYPNPTDGIFTINVSNGEQGTLKIINIYNGVVFEEKNNKQKEFHVNIAKQIPGIYIVQFTSESGIVTTKKIIKK
ncbi:T9SS C-terminal target domain-containing protein [Flavobacterium circumlabens]|uniref:Secreted protein (Por secretion system target) n=1 Tax=Flavobacterium circumlabens TaxID=2133765 RepID=A0A4Y7U8Z8_9FLAO|nr:S8 family serine peptidase [Flavobacterium circumlabens]TCN54713.1 putative secreted protein (Por secretion system target) [Flavobacterium circumlabens]TEB42905.1 T9SS C-terminal target domain-containing protein [Flavobacterium circumlabens]